MQRPVFKIQLPPFHAASGEEHIPLLEDFLRNLIQQILAVDVSYRIPFSSEWLTVIEHVPVLFDAIPLDRDTDWAQKQELLAFVDMSLDAFRLVALHVERVFNQKQNFWREPLIKLLYLGFTLEHWVGEEPAEALIWMPSAIRLKVLPAYLALIQSLDDYGTISGDPHEGEHPVLTLLLGCLAAVKEVIQLLPISALPCTLHPYSNPTIVNGIDGKPSGFPLRSATDIPLLAVTLLHFVAQALSLPLQCRSLLYQAQRRATQLTQDLFYYILSPACSATALIRAQSLSRLISIASLIYKGHDQVTDQAKQALRILPLHLLHHRLIEGSQLSWKLFEDELQTALSTPGFLICGHSDMETLMDCVLSHSWEESANADPLLELVKIYVSQVTPQLAPQVLSALVDKATLAGTGPARDILVEALSAPQPMDTHTSINGLDWRIELSTSLKTLVQPTTIDWMEVDAGIQDQEYIQFAIYEFKRRFDSPLLDASPEGRLSVASQLEKLLCIAARCDIDGDHARLPGEATLPSCQAFLRRLLEGKAEEVTNEVRGKVYSVYNHLFCHDEPSLSKPVLDECADVFLRGLCDTSRGVRLSAGRAINQMLQIYDSTPELVSAVFNQFYRMSDTCGVQVTEILLITVGMLAKGAKPTLLEPSVCFFISQFSRNNTLLRSLAYTQCYGVARHLNKTPYGLIQPFLSLVAPFLGLRIVSQPILLAETCRLISLSPTVFISTNLTRILPPVFASSELKVLEQISKELQTSPAQLFMQDAQDILSFIFLLPSQKGTNSGLLFVRDVLGHGDQHTITIPNIVTSCLVPLLTELVVSLGDEIRGHFATDALVKLDKALHGSKASAKSPGSSALLKEHMLGIITSITHLLQEVRVKQSAASKRRILRSFGILSTIIGPSITNVAPQIMATFQTMVTVPELADVTLHSWFQFISTLDDSDAGPLVGPISATLVSCWPSFSASARELAKKLLRYIICTKGPRLDRYLDDIVDLSSIEELQEESTAMETMKGEPSKEEQLQRILEHSYNANVAVALQSLGELKRFMTQHESYICNLASGDIFDPLIGQTMSALFSAACRDSEGSEELHLSAYECISILGAVDPDRCEIRPTDSRMIMTKNFVDEEESVAFALHLISDLLVGAYRSTSDVRHQGHLGLCIQELLKFCQFTTSLVSATGTQPVPMKVRNKWKGLPKHVLETVTPLLGGKFTLNLPSHVRLPSPIYPSQTTYREWIQLWAVQLIDSVSGKTPQTIFGVFRAAVRNKDVGVARFLLPHLVLNILISGKEEDSDEIRSEILAVLEDQVALDSPSSPDKKLLSAQAIFMLLDHLGRWVRVTRQDLSTTKRLRVPQVSAEHLMKVESVLSSIDQNLMARAALQCKAYARSLMNFENILRTIGERSSNNPDLPIYYERLHEIYAHLDEPDGMEGVSTLILNPSLEHQIRQHESLGQWTSAQSCWELRLQKEPDNLDFHVGLLRCLRNLGHYDTLRTHVTGVLTRNPDWQPTLVGYQVESACMVGAWDEVGSLVKSSQAHTSEIIMAQVLLDMRSGDMESLKKSLASARATLGGPITASGWDGFRHSYDCVLDLHRTYELEMIANLLNLPSPRRQAALKSLSQTLAHRLDAILPTFRNREPVLSMRRTALTLRSEVRALVTTEVGKSWLASSKIARKAGQWQTAYSATLHARQLDDTLGFIESARLLKAMGEPVRALRELENSMSRLGLFEDSTVVDLTMDDEDSCLLKAKAQVLRAQWMHESGRYEENLLLKMFGAGADTAKNWESANYHLAVYHDAVYKGLTGKDRIQRAPRMCAYSIKHFARSLKYGSKHVYQTVPRLLTIWFEIGEDKHLCESSVFPRINEVVSRAFVEIPTYKWYTAFPQIVSRIGHSNKSIVGFLGPLISVILKTHLSQALWLFVSIVNSKTPSRAERGKEILDKIRNVSSPTAKDKLQKHTIDSSLVLMKALLHICQYPIRQHDAKLSIGRNFPSLRNLPDCSFIVPLQQSLTANMPPPTTPYVEDPAFQPFPINSPTIVEFLDEVEIMSSLARPRKITVRGSDGVTYSFLAKPKDDLRKDARIMDLNTVVNKILRGNSESRRRQLHIRTYAAVPLNDECGLIQWVPHTMCIRPILLKAYGSRVTPAPAEMQEIFDTLKGLNPPKAAQLFSTKVLPRWTPVFHEWFIETFPEPSAWLAGRSTYARTLAVMSMVGFMVGLGDRHCENILLDVNTGDIVHCDFNCLFEKGKLLDVPERVPFRLTQNLVDGLGVTGYEGVFRVACELTLRQLRQHKDTLLSILDAFIHDPLVEWEDDRRKMEREQRNQVQDSVDLKMLAKNALVPMEKRLNGQYSPKEFFRVRGPKDTDSKEVSVSALVQLLLQGATDPENLGKMYIGWAPWH